MDIDADIQSAIEVVGLEERKDVQKRAIHMFVKVRMFLHHFLNFKNPDANN